METMNGRGDGGRPENEWNIVGSVCRELGKGAELWALG